MDKNNFF